MEPIAIIGIGCRFPGAKDPQAFWQLLCDGVDAITEIPGDRWQIEQLYHSDPDEPGRMNSRYGGFLEQVDQFDPHFFGISPREAVSIDPQQRLLLEVSWEALEDAGQVRENLAGSRTGVFVGISTNDYSRIESDYADQPQGYDLTGNALNIAAGRLSYLFNLRGPSLVVDTACSSSLVAVHLACQSLWNGDATMALAAGVNVILSPIGNMGLTKLKALSPDGRCKAFDARANGYVRSEGAGCVVLKPLSKALADRDLIYATIRGTAINHDGRSKGLTVPYGPAQEAVIRDALAKAEVLPAQISYVEAHGTGTSLGDPIEAIALGSVLTSNRPPNQECRLGAVKSNIGHLEAAAGIASLIKVALALKHQQLPPSLHFETANPYIPFDKLPLKVQTKLTSWTQPEALAKAGVSSFGFAGTNAHLVLEQAPHPVDCDRQTILNPPYLLPLSAHTSDALQALVQTYQDFLAGEKLDAIGLQDLCYTASVRRSHHKHRVALLVSESNLSSQAKETKVSAASRKSRRSKVVFVFSDQGAEWWGMGREALQSEPVFRAALKDCDALIQSYAGWSLLSELTAAESQSRLHKAEIAQPALFAIQVALAHLWQFWGIKPSAVVGYGSGEIAAAHVAGVLGLKDAVQLICDRGDVIQQAKTTGQLATAEFVKAIRSQVDPRPETMPIVSGITGQFQSGTQFDAAYWGQNLEQPVRFTNSLSTLIEAHTVFLELSPNPTLAQAIAPVLEAHPQEGIILPSLQQGQPERATLLQSLGRLYQLGHSVNWENLYLPGCSVVRLPTYPWQRERYWVEKTPSPETQKQPSAKPTDKQTMGRAAGQTVGQTAGHPLLGQKLRSPLPHTLFESYLSVEQQSFLTGHQVVGMVVLPGAAYLEMAIAAAANVLGSSTLEQVAIQEAMILPSTGDRLMQFVLSPDGTFQIASVAAESDKSWIQHATGKISQSLTPSALPTLSLAEVQARCIEAIAVETYYQQLKTRGLEYGASFQGLQQLWRRDGEALGYVQLPEELRSQANAYYLHPVLMDAGFQLLFATLANSDHETYLPVGLQRLHLYQRPETDLWIQGQMRPQPTSEASQSDIQVADLHLFNPDGGVVALLEGLQVKRVRNLRSRPHTPLQDWLYELTWQPQPQEAQTQLQQEGSWVIFADQTGVGEAIAQQLQQQGRPYVLVVPGEECHISQDQPWQINPSRREDWQQLCEAVLRRGQFPVQTIVHLWGLDQNQEELTLDSLHAAQKYGCQSVLQIIQELSVVLSSGSGKLWIVTRGNQPVNGSVSTVAHAGLWGLGRVISLEHPDLWGGLIDLSITPSVEEVTMLLTQLLHPSPETHIGFREGQRYVARLVPSRISELSKEPSPEKLLLQSHSTYLITGGLGSLGLKLTQMLAEKGAEHLVLVSRRPASEQAQATLRELVALGTQIHVIQADISQADEVNRLLAEIKDSFPPLRGVFHAAGVLDDGMLTQQTWERFTSVMAPKLAGAWNLHHATQDLPLDHFVMFSSIASVLGSPGQGNYAAANAFLDALAHYRQAQQLPGLSINWGTWADGGMAARLGDREQQRLSALGMEAIASQQGLQILEHLMQQAIAQVGVVPVQWGQFFAQMPAIPSLLMEIAQATVPDRTTQQPSEAQRAFLLKLEKAPVRDRHDLLMSHLQEQTNKVLRLSLTHVLDPYQGFFDLGMDSLTSVELRNTLQISLGRSLASTLIFDYPTIAALAGYLSEELFADASIPVQTAASTPLTQPESTLTHCPTDIENLSEEDAEALLLQELEGIH